MLVLLNLGRVDAGFANRQIIAELERLLGAGHKVSIGGSSVGLRDGEAVLELANVEIAGPEAAPAQFASASVTLDPLALVQGIVVPHAITLSGGSIALDRPQAYPETTGSLGLPAPAGKQGLPALLSQLLGSDEAALALQMQDISLTVGHGASAFRIDRLRIGTERDSSGRRLLIQVPMGGEWHSLTIRKAPAASDGLSLAVSLTDWPLGLATAWLGFPAQGTADARISAVGDVRLGRDGFPDAANLLIETSGLPSPFAFSPGPVSASARAVWSSAANSLTLEGLQASLGTMRFSAQAELAASAEGMRIALAGGQLQLNAAEPSAAALSNIALDASFDPRTSAISVSNLALEGEGFTLAGDLTVPPEGAASPILGTVRLSEASLSGLSGWLAAAGVHEAAAILRDAGGTVSELEMSVSLPRAAWDENDPLASLRKASISAKGRFAGLSLPARADLPRLTRIGGTITLKKGRLEAVADEAMIDLKTTAGQPVDSLSLVITSVLGESPRGVLTVSIRDSIKTLKANALKTALPKAVRDALAKLGDSGTAQIRLTRQVQFDGSEAGLPDIKLTLKGATIRSVAEGFDLAKADLAIDLGKGGIAAEGTGFIRSLPASVTYKAASLEADGIATAKINVDDKARRALGFAFGAALKGPVVIRVATGGPKPAITLDLTAASSRDLVPGWTKPAGRAASAEMRLKADGKDGYRLEEMSFVSSALKFSGVVLLGADGQFREARLTSLTLPDGATGEALIRKQKSLWSVTLTSNTLDARPWLSSLDAMTSNGSLPLALSLRATALQGFNGEIIAGAALDTTLQDGRISQARFDGRINGRQVTTRITPRGNGLLLRLRAADAGALLRFMDVYTRMVGGTIEGAILMQPGGQTGTIGLKDFVLANEPALRRIAAQSSGQIADTRTSFQRGRVRFTRQKGITRLHEAVMWGNEIGGNIIGDIDPAGDRINLAGSFVPAYALNNFFARLPLVGAVLGGESYEGLFAVPFTVTGKASNPRLTVNALSAVAPGILRKLLDFKARPELPEVP